VAQAERTRTTAPPPPPPPPPHRRGAIGRLERLARERHAKDLALCTEVDENGCLRGHPRGLYYDPAAAERPIVFIEQYCKHHKAEWAGKPLILEEWQKADVIRPLFGWMRADGTRRYRTALIEIARKNGKSELVAALGLYLLIADGEPGAEIYASATKKDQAKIVWDTAEAMVKKSTRLQKYVRTHRSNGGTLYCDRIGSFFVPLGADSKTLDGLNPHANLVDELHAHENRSVWDVLITALGARRQPLTVAITTAGVYDQESIGWQQHDYGVQVLEGTWDDDGYFVFICAMDDGDDPHSEEAQQKANPNLGISPKLSYIQEQSETAKRQPSFYNEYLRLHLNAWTQQVTRWLPPEAWEACEGGLHGKEALEARPAREKELLGRECFGGLDLASKLDLAAFALLFPLAATRGPRSCASGSQRPRSRRTSGAR
jgi:phage terminase large subunit-like protein